MEHVDVKVAFNYTSTGRTRFLFPNTKIRTISRYFLLSTLFLFIYYINIKINTHTIKIFINFKYVYLKIKRDVIKEIEKFLFNGVKRK